MKGRKERKRSVAITGLQDAGDFPVGAGVGGRVGEGYQKFGWTFLQGRVKKVEACFVCLFLVVVGYVC